MSFFDRGPSLVKIFLAEGGVEGMVDTHDAPFSAIGEFFFGEADFFSAKRLFLRAARDVSGAHSEPPWARLGKNRKRVFGFIPIAARERAPALTSPPPRLFVLFHPSKPHHPSKSHHPTQTSPNQAAAIKNRRK